MPTLASRCLKQRGCRLVPGLRGALDPPFLPPGSSLTLSRKLCFVVCWLEPVSAACNEKSYLGHVVASFCLCAFFLGTHTLSVKSSVSRKARPSLPGYLPLSTPSRPRAPRTSLLASLPSWKSTLPPPLRLGGRLATSTGKPTCSALGPNTLLSHPSIRASVRSCLGLCVGSCLGCVPGAQLSNFPTWPPGRAWHVVGGQ